VLWSSRYTEKETRESYTVGKNELSHALSTPPSMALSPVALILQQDVQFFMYVYFYSIHVSDSHVTIITSWAHGGLKHVENRNIHT